MPKFSEITVTDAGKPGRPLFSECFMKKKGAVLSEPIFVSSKKKET
jgi:hypothetical protein